MSPELAIYVRKCGPELGYAIEALRTVQLKTGVNLEELFELVKKYECPANEPNRCLLPNIDAYPPAQRLRALVALAVTLIRKEYVHNLDQGKLPIGLGAIAMLYNLHFGRTMAAIRQPNFDRPLLLNPPLSVAITQAPEGYVPPVEARRHLSTALEIRGQLKPIDEVIAVIYGAYVNNNLASMSLRHAGNLIFQIYEKLQQERRANALDEDAFF